MAGFLKIVFLLFFTFVYSAIQPEVDENQFSVAKERRYLLYGVNHGEGFNLRRDVYMRVANLVRQLREKGENFVLVLPPWGGIYHWQSRSAGDQIKIPWSRFFDLTSLERFVPVIEFERFLEETHNSNKIQQVYYLQGYREGWVDGKWEEKWDVRDCLNEGRGQYEYDEGSKKWHGWFWAYGDSVTAEIFQCISIQGHTKTLIPLVLHENNTEKISIMIDRAETVLHDDFGSVNYWKARMSMRYAPRLRALADNFRRDYLDSTDYSDETVLDEDWTKTKVKPGSALGGPYLAVHWRRKDFIRAHGKELPSVNGTAAQLLVLLRKHNLPLVFLSTDAPKSEIDKLKELLLAEDVMVKVFEPSPEVLREVKEGGVSIVDQWICAHARYFIGSYVSTFSFRIHEDREILGFDPVTTFNRLCPDANLRCEQPAKWKLVQ